MQECRDPETRTLFRAARPTYLNASTKSPIGLRNALTSINNTRNPSEALPQTDES